MRLTLYFSILLLAISIVITNAQTELPEGLIQEGAVAFNEGPAWHAASKNLYFTDIENNRIMRRDPTGKIHVYRTPSGRANGLAFDSKGRLIACEGGREGGNKRITRTELDGSITVLTDNYQGKRYNSPNDLAIDAKDRIYFTDPRYGDRSDMEIADSDGKFIEGVFRIDPDGTVEMILAHEVDRPNGIGISKDQKYLFVADNNSDMNGSRKMLRFDLNADGSVAPESSKELFDWKTDRGPDGFDIGSDGKLYVTAGLNYPFLPANTSIEYKAGIYVIDPEGDGLKSFLPIPADMITNCTFGGEDGKTLYITAGHFLWSLPIK